MKKLFKVLQKKRKKKNQDQEEHKGLQESQIIENIL